MSRKVYDPYKKEYVDIDITLAQASNTKITSIKDLETFDEANSSLSNTDYSNKTIQNLVKAYNQLEIGYVKKIEAYCWFYNTGENVGLDDYKRKYFRYKMNTGREAHYYRCEMAKINIDKLSISSEKLTNLYNELLEYSRGYSTKQLDLFSDIKMDLKTFLGDVELSKAKNRKDSYVNYNDLSIAKEKINALYNEIDKFSISNLKNNIINKASDVKFRVNTDIELVGDTSYGYDLVDTEQRKFAESAIDYAPLRSHSSCAEFVIPSTSQMITYIQSKFPKIKFEGKKLIYGMNNIFGNKGIIVSLGKKVDGLKENLKSLKKKINGICEAYNKLENSAKNKFEGNKTHKKYSKTEIAVKYSGLVGKLKDAGYSKQEANKYAKKYLSKILKKTNSKVTSAEVLSIYKKYKNKKKISGNLNSKEGKDTKRTKKNTARKSSSKSSSTTTAMAATGATVAATKVKKSAKSSSTKDTKKTSKKTKTKVKQGVLTTVPTLATLKAMKKQLKSNTTIKLSNIKTEANNKIVAIEGKAEDQKRLAEIEKNNTIKQINENAASKIGAIDANDSEANTKIENIQKEAEEEIEKTNTAYENKVNEIEEKKNKDIAQVNSDKNNATKDVEEKSNKELKEINDDIEKAKKTKSSKKSTTTKVSSEATEKKTESKEYNSTVNDSSVETSEQAANDSSTKLDEAVNTKQEEITSAEQAKIDAADSVTDNSSSDSSANVAQPETSSTPEQTTSASVDDIDTDTSSSDTGYSSSSNYDASSYNNNSSSTDYSTVDETKQSNVNSSNTGVDQSTLHTDSTTKSTFDIKKDTTSSSTASSNKDIDDISSISSTKSTSSKKSSGLGAAVPIGLGIAATGAAAVAGVRYVKNKKLNEDYDENYDDENNDVYEDEVPSDSAYMADDYLGPEGSSYTEVPDDNEYTDTEALEEEAGVSDFSEDAALNELN